MTLPISEAEKPSFKKAFRQRRCIVPASGYYEWMMGETGMVPHYIKPLTDPMFGFAGIYEESRGKSGEIPTFAIITTLPLESILHIHHRMPLVLGKEDYSDWLDDPERAAKLMTQPMKTDIENWQVSKFVNSPSNDSEECIKRPG